MRLIPLLALSGALVASAPGASDDDCRLLSDFTTEADRARWEIVNDDIMGGKSLGGVRFGGDAMIVEGTIDLDGGGFSSVRTVLEDALAPDDARAVLTLRSAEGRDWRFIVEDSEPFAYRQAVHRTTLELPPGEWTTVTIDLDALAPSVFGRPVPSLPPLDRPAAWRLGLMLFDGEDGPFSLEVDRIELCRA